MRVATALLVVATCCLISCSAPVSPPNILYIVLDDMTQRTFTDQVMPHTKTRIEDQGVTFTNAFVSNPNCCPSRATALSGQYPHNTGVQSNLPADGGWENFRDEEQNGESFPQWLDAAGYRTGHVGKYLNGHDINHIPPGYDYWVGRGLQDFNDNGTVRDLRGTGIDPEVFTYVKAQEFLEGATQKPDPWMLYWAPMTPHLPARVPKGYGDLYPNAKVPRVPSYNEADVSDKPRWVRRLPKLDQATQDNEDARWRLTLQRLHRTDNQINSALNLLDRRGQLDNTYVIFTSDNGSHFGEHRYAILRGAKVAPYQESVRVPLAVRGPGVRKGATANRIVGNLDIAPTFSDIADAPHTEVDGRSFLGLLRHAVPVWEWRKRMLIERVQIQPDGNIVPSYRGFVTEGATYVRYEDGFEELYNRRVDPYELNNLSSPEQVSPRDTSTWRIHLTALRDCKGVACRVAEARRNGGIYVWAFA